MTAAPRPSGPPPHDLLQRLVDGPAFVTAFEWHDEIDSTNRRAAELAADGRPEGLVIAADVQTAGRGRKGRGWAAPAGTSLMASFLLRPGVAADDLPLLPLLAGLALAEVAERHVTGAPVTLKWPNDLLVAERKAAGILVEAHGAAAILGIGVNVDWRGVERQAELAGATSLAEVAGADVDRWSVLAGLVGVLGNRYAAWCAEPRGFLPDYEARCATIGRRVRVEVPDGQLEGTAQGLADSGALVVRRDDATIVELVAGDVIHVRTD